MTAAIAFGVAMFLAGVILVLGILGSRPQP